MAGTLMNTAAKGIFWCLVFLLLDSLQAVYFGTALQRMDSFLVGALVFGLSSTACLFWAGLYRRGELRSAFAHGRVLLGFSAAVACAWITYLFAVQLIEPAVAFALFCGAIPLTALVHEGMSVRRNGMDLAGHAVLVFGMFVLAAITLLGFSGFVRGELPVAGMGLLLAVLSGVLMTIMLILSRILDRAGISPLTQFGLRFPLYVALSFGGFMLGFDDKGAVETTDLVHVVLIGFLLLAFPIYAVQKAVSLVSTATIGAFAAAAPLVVFLLQMMEGRVTYSDATLAGLTIYFAGALLVVLGRVRTARV